jgi:hypothetical protein
VVVRNIPGRAASQLSTSAYLFAGGSRESGNGEPLSLLVPSCLVVSGRRCPSRKTGLIDVHARRGEQA